MKTKYIKPKMKFNPGIKNYEVDLDKLPRKEKVAVYFCPSCKSKDVGFVFEIRNLFGLMPKMKCRKCRYSASVFPQLVISKSKLEKLNKKKNKK